MNRKGSKRIGVSCLLCLVAWAGSAWAVYIDDERTLEFVGRAQTRTSIRLQASEGFTHPLDIAAGNVVQWRNLAVLEINHDLMNLTHDLDILYPLKALDISAKYHIVGRFMYEAIYDVGPQAFQDVRENDKENIDKFKEQYDLWEFYVDLSRGPLLPPAREAEPGLGGDRHLSPARRHQPLGQHFRRALRGPGRPADPPLDAQGELQLRKRRADLVGHDRGFLGAGQLGRERRALRACGHGLRRPDPGYGHGEVPRHSRQEDVQQSVGSPPDGRPGEQPQLERRPLQDISGHAHGRAGGRAGNASRHGDELLVPGTDLGRCADHGRLLQLL